MRGEKHRLAVEVPVECLGGLLQAASEDGKLLADYARDAVVGWRDVIRFSEAMVKELAERKELLERFAREFRRVARPDAIGEGAEGMVEAWNQLCGRFGVGEWTII